jgi:hypothetical protein
VRLLNLAVRDLIDPALLWCVENAAPPELPPNTTNAALVKVPAPISMIV